jgi:phage anti-repressor protein
MNFRDFLIKNSFVNEKFINDFYDIIKEDYMTKYNEFLIDSDILQKWLQIKQKQKFRDKIKKLCRKDIDYKIKTIKKTDGSGGHNAEYYILTPEAAKKICLTTQSALGDEVRQYFIDIELALYSYKEYVIDGMNRKIKQLENNQKPKIHKNKKMIYVFRALNTDATLYKIGRTINSKTRFNNHNSPLANDIEVLFNYETENAEQLESCLKAHMKIAQYRKYKEIYEVDLQIIKKIIKDCDASIRKINEKIENSNKKAKQTGGTIVKKIKSTDILYLLLPQK